MLFKFFDVSIVRYPSSFSYPSSYETRMLTPVANYDAGTTTFTTIDISSSISHDYISGYYRFRGGVLSPNGLIFFIPLNADCVGVVDPISEQFKCIDISSSISHDWKFFGGVLSPNGLIFFIPSVADVIGKVQLSNTYPSYKVEGGLAESWKALLSPYFNKF